MLAVLLSAAMLLGLAAGVVRPLDAGGLLVALAGSVAGLAAAWRAPVWRLAALLCVACALSALRPTLWPAPTADGLTPLLDTQVLARGTVAAPPNTSGQVVTFNVDVYAAGPAPATGSPAPAELPEVSARLQAVARRDSTAGRLQVGDDVQVVGKLVAPTSPAGFPRAELLRRQGILATMSFPRVTLLERAEPTPAGTAVRVREAIAGGIERDLPQPQAALATGMLLGGAGGMSPATRQQMQTAGLGHLIAVSGYKKLVPSSQSGMMASHRTATFSRPT